MRVTPAAQKGGRGFIGKDMKREKPDPKKS